LGVDYLDRFSSLRTVFKQVQISQLACQCHTFGSSFIFTISNEPSSAFIARVFAIRVLLGTICVFIISFAFILHRL